MGYTMGDKMKVVMKRRSMTVTELAAHLGTSRQNLTNKFKRDNFSVKEIEDISAALNCEFEGTLTMKDTGEKF